MSNALSEASVTVQSGTTGGLGEGVDLRIMSWLQHLIPKNFSGFSFYFNGINEPSIIGHF